MFGPALGLCLADKKFQEQTKKDKIAEMRNKQLLNKNADTKYDQKDPSFNVPAQNTTGQTGQNKQVIKPSVVIQNQEMVKSNAIIQNQTTIKPNSVIQNQEMVKPSIVIQNQNTVTESKTEIPSFQSNEQSKENAGDPPSINSSTCKPPAQSNTNEATIEDYAALGEDDALWQAVFAAEIENQ